MLPDGEDGARRAPTRETPLSQGLKRPAGRPMGR